MNDLLVRNSIVDNKYNSAYFSFTSIKIYAGTR